MNISTKDTRLYNLSFKGYDARPLKGFIMMTNYGGIANEMANIGTKESFDVFINNGLTSISKIKKLPLTDKFNMGSRHFNVYKKYL